MTTRPIGLAGFALGAGMLLSATAANAHPYAGVYAVTFVGFCETATLTVEPDNTTVNGVINASACGGSVGPGDGFQSVVTANISPFTKNFIPIGDSTAPSLGVALGIINIDLRRLVFSSYADRAAD